MGPLGTSEGYGLKHAFLLSLCTSLAWLVKYYLTSVAGGDMSLFGTRSRLASYMPDTVSAGQVEH